MSYDKARIIQHVIIASMRTDSGKKRLFPYPEIHVIAEGRAEPVYNLYEDLVAEGVTCEYQTVQWSTQFSGNSAEYAASEANHRTARIRERYCEEVS